MASFPHIPVLVHEVLHAFEPLLLEGVVDGTLGAGGHAESLLERHPEIQYYLGIDQDPYALALAKERLMPWASKVAFRHGNFAHFDEFLKELSLPRPNAILADLGLSSMQIDQPFRGFSFMHEGPLDMRMNPLLALTASTILNTWPERELGEVFRDYGEEKHWRSAARVIVQARQEIPFTNISDLKRVLMPVLGRHAKKGIHPLTLIFQALRICVNRELEALDVFLPKALDLLSPGGRLAVISFHSLEDRIVKTHMRWAASDKWETSGIGGLFRDKEPTVKMVSKKIIMASPEEIERNPRSRSAKLRIAEKLGNREG